MARGMIVESLRRAANRHARIKLAGAAQFPVPLPLALAAAPERRPRTRETK
jgi:hypothetical protein